MSEAERRYFVRKFGENEAGQLIDDLDVRKTVRFPDGSLVEVLITSQSLNELHEVLRRGVLLQLCIENNWEIYEQLG